MPDRVTAADVTAAILLDAVLRRDPSAATTLLALDEEMGDGRRICRPDLVEFVVANSLGMPYTDGTADLHSSVRDWIVSNVRQPEPAPHPDTSQPYSSPFGPVRCGKTLSRES